MEKKNIQIRLEKGEEARSIALLVQEASKYESRIYIEEAAKRVNAKSIMGMMSLSIDNGKEVLVTAEGTDEQAAVEAIWRFLGKGA